jgi:hypothetical protein
MGNGIMVSLIISLACFAGMGIVAILLAFQNEKKQRFIMALEYALLKLTSGEVHIERIVVDGTADADAKPKAKPKAKEKPVGTPVDEHKAKEKPVEAAESA